MYVYHKQIQLDPNPCTTYSYVCVWLLSYQCSDKWLVKCLKRSIKCNVRRQSPPLYYFDSQIDQTATVAAQLLLNNRIVIILYSI